MVARTASLSSQALAAMRLLNIQSVFGPLRVIAVVWLIVAGFLFVQLWPDIPQSKAQWFLFVALGPPLYVLGESLFSWVFSPAHGKAISDRTFSFRRIAVALPIILAVCVLCWWLSWLLSSPY